MGHFIVLYSLYNHNLFDSHNLILCFELNMPLNDIQTKLYNESLCCSNWIHCPMLCTVCIHVWKVRIKKRISWNVPKYIPEKYTKIFNEISGILLHWDIVRNFVHRGCTLYIHNEIQITSCPFYWILVNFFLIWNVLRKDRRFQLNLRDNILAVGKETKDLIR